MEEVSDRWDKRHAEAGDLGRPARVLEENRHLLPEHGQALDMACGRGFNALTLARMGLEVHAWDISPVAIGLLESAASDAALSIRCQVRDVIADPPAANSFDLILVSYFLERSLVKPIIEALRPGGVLFYQTFTRNAVSDCGPSDPLYRLGENELLEMFQELCIRVYREEGRTGDCSRGWRDLAMLVGEKPGRF